MSAFEAAKSPAQSKREARRRAIMDAAARLFLEKGYGATSLGDIVAKSGGSLATLYEMFGNKAGLYKALITDRCQQAVEHLDAGPASGRDLRDDLNEHGKRLLDLVLSSDAVRLIRLIIAEGPQFPELAQLFFASGPDLARERVAQYLAAQMKRKLLQIDDTAAAARAFCALVIGDYKVRAICGLDTGLDEAAKDRHIREAVDLFLKAHAPRP